MNDILKFVTKYTEMFRNREYNAILKETADAYKLHYFRKSSISFNLSMKETDSFVIGNPSGELLINLDDEDLRILFTKYSKQLDSELSDKVAKLMKEYGK